MDSNRSRCRGNVFDSGDICYNHQGKEISDALKNDLDTYGVASDGKTLYIQTIEDSIVSFPLMASNSFILRRVRFWNLLAVTVTVGIIVWVALWWLGILTY